MINKIKNIMKIMFITMLLLISVPMGAFAEDNNNTGITNDDDEEVEDNSNQEEEDSNEEEIEIEVEVKDGMAEIQVEINDEKTDYTLNSTDETEILSDIAYRFNLTENVIIDIWKFEIENSKEDSNEEEIEIEVEVKDGMAEIQVEINDEKTDYTLNSTDETEILSDIAYRFNLTENLIIDIWKFEIEDSKEDSNEEEEEEERESYNKVEEVTEDEVRILRDNTGAQIRLLQLQKRVEFQIDAANIIIDRIESLNKSEQFDMNNLTIIIEDLESINVQIEEFDFNRTSDELAEDFVALKKEAIELTKEFRDTIKDGLTDEDKRILKSLINEAKKQDKAKVNERIKSLVKKYNSEKAENLLERLGDKNSELLAKYEAGEISEEELKDMLKKAYNNLNATQKEKAKSKLKENLTKQKIEVEQKREQLKQDVEERREELKQRFEERREELKQRLEERREEFKEKREELRDKDRIRDIGTHEEEEEEEFEYKEENEEEDEN